MLPKDVERFMAKVSPIDGHGGQMWLGALDSDGYGHFRHDGWIQKAHRVAWEIATGSPPGDFLVLHTCDRPACVYTEGLGIYYVDGVARLRLGHLFLGDYRINAVDRDAKGRGAGAKLVSSQVLQIRARCMAGESSEQLAKEFGVISKSIRNIKNGKTWMHV